MFDELRFYENRNTKERFCLDGSESRRVYMFKKRLKGLRRLAEAEKLTVYFLTLTLSTSHMEKESSDLHRFLNFIRGRCEAHGMKFHYAWVLEYQMARYARYGDLVRHWHIAIAVPLGCLPNVKYVKHARKHYQVVSDGSVINVRDLLRFWGYGQALCEVSRGNLVQYLCKYLVKNVEQGVSGTRMFSSSVIRWWGFAGWAFGVIRECMISGFDILRAKMGWYQGDTCLQLSVTDGQESNSLRVMSPWVRVAE